MEFGAAGSPSVNGSVQPETGPTSKKVMGISREISYKLEHLILEGGLAPGQKIPSERQLVARLGVSRSVVREALHELQARDRKSTRLNSSHVRISYAVFCLKKKKSTS